MPHAPVRPLVTLTCAVALLLPAAAAQSSAPVASAPVADAPVAQAGLSLRIAAFHQAVAESVGAAGADQPALAAFYRDRGFQPLWTGAGDADRRRDFLSALARAG